MRWVQLSSRPGESTSYQRVDTKFSELTASMFLKSQCGNGSETPFTSSDMAERSTASCFRLYSLEAESESRRHVSTPKLEFMSAVFCSATQRRGNIDRLLAALLTCSVFRSLGSFSLHTSGWKRSHTHPCHQHFLVVSRAGRRVASAASRSQGSIHATTNHQLISEFWL